MSRIFQHRIAQKNFITTRARHSNGDASNGLNDTLEGWVHSTNLSNFAIGTWIKVDSLSSASYVLIGGNLSVQVGIIWGFVPSQTELWVSPPIGYNLRTNSGITLPDTEWHHIAYVYSGRLYKYLDGIKTDCWGGDQAAQAPGTPKIVGFRDPAPGGASFAGALYDFFCTDGNVDGYDAAIANMAHRQLFSTWGRNPLDTNNWLMNGSNPEIDLGTAGGGYTNLTEAGSGWTTVPGPF